MNRRVFVLTVTEAGETTVEGVYETAQAAADTVAEDYTEADDRFLDEARDLDCWHEEDPDRVSYQSVELGPDVTWMIARHEVESELPEAAPRARLRVDSFGPDTKEIGTASARTAWLDDQLRERRSTVVDIDGPTPVGPSFVQADEYACPGCGCVPGDGYTPGCEHPDGCGFYKDSF